MSKSPVWFAAALLILTAPAAGAQTVTELYVTPDTIRIEPGQRRGLTVQAFDEAGNVVLAIKYRTLDPSVASVAANGTVTAGRAGSTAVMVEAGRKTRMVTVYRGRQPGGRSAGNPKRCAGAFGYQPADGGARDPGPAPYGTWTRGGPGLLGRWDTRPGRPAALAVASDRGRHRRGFDRHHHGALDGPGDDSGPGARRADARHPCHRGARGARLGSGPGAALAGRA